MTYLVIEVGVDGADWLQHVDGGHHVVVPLVPLVQQVILYGVADHATAKLLELGCWDMRREGPIAVFLAQENLK